MKVPIVTKEKYSRIFRRTKGYIINIMLEDPSIRANSV